MNQLQFFEEFPELINCQWYFAFWTILRPIRVLYIERVIEEIESIKQKMQNDFKAQRG